jgi:hypothetical protein
MGFEYAVPEVPEGSVALMVSAEGAVGAATTIESWIDLVCFGLPASVTATVNVAVPVAVGVPEIRPVVALRVTPAGSAPPVMDQV